MCLRFLSSAGSKGGIFLNRNKKFYTVNIRPSKWNDKNKPSKFWKGKQNHKMAQYLADAIYHYIGKPRFHFLDADHLIFPILECIGIEINTPVRLTSQEIRSEYVQSIAGEAYALQREDFICKVMNVIESGEFVLQAERFLKSREEAADFEEATHPKEDAATPKETAVSAEDWAEDTPPIEDDMGLEAMRQSQLDFSQAYAPSFEIDFNSSGKKSLQSVGQSFGSTCFSMKDCPTTLKEGQQCFLIRICRCDMVLLNIDIPSLFIYLFLFLFYFILFYFIL